MPGTVAGSAASEGSRRFDLRGRRLMIAAFQGRQASAAKLGIAI